MFKKLVSNLPFNPSLIEHIPEYTASLKKERDVRIAGLVILVVALIGQILILAIPPRSGLTVSPNNLIIDGFTSKAEAVGDCESYSNYADILMHYSISCGDIQSSNTVSIQPTSYDNKLLSLNRVAYGQFSETPVEINGQTYYLRPLYDGSGLTSVNLKALGGYSDSGTRFFILYGSADLVFIGQPMTSTICNPASIQNCPELFITARSGQINDANNLTIRPGSTIIYTLAATNLSGKTINSVSIGTDFSSALAYSKVLNLYGGSIRNSFISWPALKLLPNQTATRSVSFAVANTVPNLPLSSTDPNYYNQKMVTTYGNTVSIKLPWSFSKFFELKINNGLPTQTVLISMVISVLLIILVSYFLARNLLMLRELHHIKEDYLNGAGE